MSRISCVMLATGKSLANGQNKLLLNFAGESLVRRMAMESLNIPFEEVIAVTGLGADQVSAELRDLPMKVVFNPSYQESVAHSFRIGLSLLRKYQDGFFVLHADQADLDSHVLREMIRIFNIHEGKKIVCSTHFGVRGQTVLIPREFVPELLQSEDQDDGCSYILRKYPLRVARLETAQLNDLDRPESCDDSSLLMVAQHG